LLLRNVALIGMVVAAFAILPLAFRGSAISNPSAFRLCSALAMCSWLGAETLFFRRGLVALRSREISASEFWLGFALNATAVTLFAWNALLPNPTSPNRYVLALMCVLAVAGINFIVAVLRPKPPAA
jgi:hypothetical protein